MDNYLLYHPRAADKTGPLLGKALGIPYGTSHSGRAKVLMRYGTTSPAGQADKVLNSIEAIRRTTDKRGSLEIFLRSGVLAPAPSAVPQSLPAIGRKGRHESGSGFWLCLQAMDVTNALNSGAEYFMPYIPTRNEYRVHVLCGEALLMQKKTLRRKKTPMWPWMRNNRTGWGLDQVDAMPEICNLGITAVKSLGLDFGTADIIESDRGHLYVLEVNTAPALREERLQIWSEALRRILCAE
jgi:glutathione synthase/RimK-type ligase-like ATP-grasp enzyme